MEKIRMTVKVVDIEATPNPDALKFCVDSKLLEKGTRSFANREAAKNDIIASSLFGLRHIETVFYMDQFITVSKNPDASWSMIMDEIKKTIESVDLSQHHAAPVQETSTAPANENELLPKIEDVLKTRVLPYLANDGGSLAVLGMDGYQLKIRYQGACGSCPSSTSGTLNAIQAMLKHTIDQRITVTAG